MYNTGLYNKVCSLAMDVLTNPFWAHRNSPPLAESFLECLPYTNQVVPQNNYSIFCYDYGFVHLKSNVVFPQYSNNEVLNSKILKKSLCDIPACKIFTDGSKTADGTGCAFHILGSQALACQLPLNYLKNALYTALRHSQFTKPYPGSPTFI